MGFVREIEQPNDEKTKNGGGCNVSIAERRGKCGFNAVKINTPGFRRTNSPLPSPAYCLIIPPGISPGAFLDSPMMLLNSQVMPSPTTGAFPMFPSGGDGSMLKYATNEDGPKENGVNSSVMFKNQGEPKHLPGYSGFEDQESNVDYASLVLEPQPMDFEFPMEFPEELDAKNYAVDPSSDVKGLSSAGMDETCVDMQMTDSTTVSEHNSLPKETTDGEAAETHQLLEGDHRGYPSLVMARNSEDGYNWRKYGQKQVKGSEYPRSYYNCTHPNCMVKKKVERSFDGQITEIIYKGAPHNHTKPPPNRLAAASTFSFDEMSEMADGTRTSFKDDHDSVWAKIQSGEDIKSAYDVKPGLERTSSNSAVTNLSDPLSATRGKSLAIFESAETPEFSSALATVDEDDQPAQQNILGDDADNEEYESKKRKKDSCMIETSIASRAAREPKVVVQIESEIDKLDDGYRWRKYGQKVVKGNPNPRSYYKCTSAGCLVRKHVERAAHDLKYVITTYEGKHNHEVPAARNSNHLQSSGANAQLLALSRITNIAKHETRAQEFAPPFDMKTEFLDDYSRPLYLGNFNNDLKYGVSPFYQMKLSPLQNAMSYGSCGPNGGRHNVGHQSGSVLPEFPMPLPINLPPTRMLGHAGYDFNNGKQQAFYSGQEQLEENEMRFWKLKQEQKDELRLPILNHHQESAASLSPTALFNQSIMGGGGGYSS